MRSEISRMVATAAASVVGLSIFGTSGVRAAVVTVTNADLGTSGATAGTDLLVDGTSPTALTLTGATQLAQSLNVTSATPVTLGNTAGGAASTLTLGNTAAQANAVPGTAATDYLYVAAGSNLTVGGPTAGSGAGSLTVRLTKTGTGSNPAGSINVGAASTLTINGNLIQGGNAAGTTGGTVLLSKTGPGTLVVNGNLSTFPTAAGGGTAASTSSLNVGTGTLVLSGDNSGRLTYSNQATGNTLQTTLVQGGATLQLQANAANTTGGVSTALGRENTQATIASGGTIATNATTGVIRLAGNTPAAPSTVQLRSDSDVTFAGFNNASIAVNTGNAVFDVGSLSGTTTGKTISIAPGNNPTPASGTPGISGSGITITATGSNGYKLAIGNLFLRNFDNVLANTADVLLGNVIANSTTASTSNVVLALGGTSTTGLSAVTGVISGSADGSGSMSVSKFGGGIWSLTNTNTYAGATTINAGTLQLGDGTAGRDGTIANTSGVINNATLVYNRFAASAAAYVISGTGAVVKSGVGSQVLSGANTYSGTTTVNAGTLELAPVAQAPVLTNAGGADVVGGQLQLDYTGASIADTVRGILSASFQDATTPGVMETGQIRSSTATASRGLGYRDTGTAVIVKVALFGDADLDGGVSINDFNALAGNFGQSTGKVWVDGDFDYDGGVSINDFNLLAGGFGQSLPASSEAWTGLLAFAAAHNDLAAFEAVTGVPEPTGLALIAAGGTLAFRRRRRA